MKRLEQTKYKSFSSSGETHLPSTASERLINNQVSLRNGVEIKMNWLAKTNSTVVPTVKTGVQQIEIVGLEDKSDDKGNRVLVTFKTPNGATVNRMFFEKSITATDIKDMDNDYNHMMSQLGYEESKSVKASEVLKVGNKFYGNLKYGTNAQGYQTVYVNILAKEPVIETEAAID